MRWLLTGLVLLLTGSAVGCCAVAIESDAQAIERVSALRLVYLGDLRDSYIVELPDGSEPPELKIGMLMPKGTRVTTDVDAYMVLEPVALDRNGEAKRLNLSPIIVRPISDVRLNESYLRHHGDTSRIRMVTTTAAKPERSWRELVSYELIELRLPEGADQGDSVLVDGPGGEHMPDWQVGSRFGEGTRVTVDKGATLVFQVHDEGDGIERRFGEPERRITLSGPIDAMLSPSGTWPNPLVVVAPGFSRSVPEPSDPTPFPPLPQLPSR